eukprot:scaffold284849_cov28-Tisochrysis_lutea.AAC.1
MCVGVGARCGAGVGWRAETRSPSDSCYCVSGGGVASRREQARAASARSMVGESAWSPSVR